MALWHQQVALHPTFGPINGCLADDWFLLPHELKQQRAHAGALRAAEILTVGECAAIERALDEIARAYGGAPCPPSDAEDLHTWIEAELTERVGEAGKKIHTARSRNDQVATLLVLFVIESGGRLIDRLSELVRAACRKAMLWSELAIPLQTHGQFAAPGTVGFWVLRYATALDRVRAHARYLVSSWRQQCPLGAGAVAGSSIPLDRSKQAAALGFDGASPNALASTSTRDECLDFLFLGAQVALHLQSFATDVIAFSQTPFSWTRYPAAFGTGSSMMPNKRNPDAMELLRGEGAGIINALNHALVLLKGLPSGYNRDLQCIKPVVRDAARKLDALLTMTTAFLEELDFDCAQLDRCLGLGQIDATLLMERKVLQGTPLREAHHAVAAAIAEAASAEASACGIESYRTSGSANPAETKRVAQATLDLLDAEA